MPTLSFSECCRAIKIIISLDGRSDVSSGCVATLELDRVAIYIAHDGGFSCANTFSDGCLTIPWNPPLEAWYRIERWTNSGNDWNYESPDMILIKPGSPTGRITGSRELNDCVNYEC